MRLKDGDEILFPAHAGVILWMIFFRSYQYAVPRTRGGDPHERRQVGACAVPRTRGGDPYGATLEYSADNLFPAHAGVILSWERRSPPAIPVPRTRGGDPNNR